MSSDVNVFLVSQGANYEIEKAEGLIWAPQKTKTGSTMFYWEVLKLIKPGDILFHSVQGSIVAISEVMAQLGEEGWQGYTVAPMPETFNNYQEIDGWLVKCEYKELDDYLPLGLYRDFIIQHKTLKHSAFDKNGDINNGYCYVLEPEIAEFLMQEMINQHPYLRSIDYLNNYLKG